MRLSNKNVEQPQFFQNVYHKRNFEGKYKTLRLARVEVKSCMGYAEPRGGKATLVVD